MHSILLVEDDRAALDGLSQLLDAGRIRRDDGEGRRRGARASSRPESFDVMLLDIWLPQMTGLELLAQLPDLPHQPKVIVMTGDDSQETLLLTLREQAYQFVRKPIQPQKLMDLIRQDAGGAVRSAGHRRAVGRRDVGRSPRALRARRGRPDSELHQAARGRSAARGPRYGGARVSRAAARRDGMERASGSELPRAHRVSARGADAALPHFRRRPGLEHGDPAKVVASRQAEAGTGTDRVSSKRGEAPAGTAPGARAGRRAALQRSGKRSGRREVSGPGRRDDRRHADRAAGRPGRAPRHLADRAQPALQRRPRAGAGRAAHVDHVQLRRAVDQHGALHPDLHAVGRADGGRHELGAGALHGRARQHHRPRFRSCSTRIRARSTASPSPSSRARRTGRSARTSRR